MDQIIAACGNDCAACPRHLPRAEAELRRTAELWRNIGYRDRVVSNEEIACCGCSTDNWCRYGIVKCAAAHGTVNCGVCPGYPCPKIEDCFQATERFRPAACQTAAWDDLRRAFFEKRENLEHFILTKRLILRSLTVQDAEDAFEWQSDPEVNRYMVYPLYTDIGATREWIRGLRREDNEFGFQLRDTGKVIGAGGIRYIPNDDAWELGYNLNREYWGQGYATEASRALIRWAYDRGARDFTAAHATANVASGNVIRKCGFELVRYGQYSRYDGSETYDASFYRMHME